MRELGSVRESTVSSQRADLGLNLPAGYIGGGLPVSLIVTGGGGPGLLTAETSEARTVGLHLDPGLDRFQPGARLLGVRSQQRSGQFGAANIVFSCHTRRRSWPTRSAICSIATRPASLTFGQIIRSTTAS